MNKPAKAQKGCSMEMFAKGNIFTGIILSDASADVRQAAVASLLACADPAARAGLQAQLDSFQVSLLAVRQSIAQDIISLIDTSVFRDMRDTVDLASEAMLSGSSVRAGEFNRRSSAVVKTLKKISDKVGLVAADNKKLFEVYSILDAAGTIAGAGSLALSSDVKSAVQVLPLQSERIEAMHEAAQTQSVSMRAVKNGLNKHLRTVAKMAAKPE